MGQSHAQPEGKPRGQFAPFVRPGNQHHPRLNVPAKGLQRGDVEVGLVFRQQRVIDRVDLFRALGDGLLRRNVQRVAQQPDSQFLAQAVGQPTADGQQFGRCRAQFLGGGLSQYQYPSGFGHRTLVS